MFNVEARNRHVVVTSFDVMGKKNAVGQCVVYAREGRYQNHEQSDKGWDLVFDRYVLGQKYASTRLELNRAVTVPAGAVRAFYIWCKNEIQYAYGDKDDGRFSFDQDDSIALFGGIVSKKLFSDFKGYGLFSGGIRWELSVLLFLF